jgi:hypothetical protein
MLPHPPIWQPVTGSEETIRWCGRQDIHPIFLIGPTDNLKAATLSIDMKWLGMGESASWATR